MLTEIILENFKAFGRRQSAPLAPITLVYGPNSGGKSSLLNAIGVLAQSFANSGWQNHLSFGGRAVDVGSFDAALYGHDAERVMTLGVGFPSVPQALERDLAPKEVRHFAPSTVELKLASSIDTRNQAIPRRIATRLGLGQDSKFDCLFSPAEDAPFKLANAASAKSWVEYFREQVSEGVGSTDANLLGLARRLRFDGDFLPYRQDPKTVPTDQLGGLAPDTFDLFANLPDCRAREGIRRSVLWVVASSYYRALRSAQYIGPLRAPPGRFFAQLSQATESVGSRGQNTAQVIWQGREYLPALLSQWFTHLEIDYEVIVSPLGKVRTDGFELVLIDRHGVKLGIADVGVGINQMLPILVSGLITIGLTVCVEQPEIHLHPRLQAKLADFFISTAFPVSADEGKQWIIETHSELLVLRLQRRIRERKLEPSQVAILYVQPGGTDGAEIRELRMDENGDFMDAWPHGFFDDGFREQLA